MSGFVCLHRDALDHPLLQDPARLGAWFWLVARAAWQPTSYDIKGKIVVLQRGQLCVSFRQLSEQWGWSKSAVERFFTRLKTETMIETDNGTSKSIVTICNYSKYQDKNYDAGTVSETHIGTTSGQHRDTKEQGNKGTIYEEDKSSSVISENDKDEIYPSAKLEIDEAIHFWKLGAEKCGWKIPRKIDATRRAKLAARLNENGLEGWKEALRKAVRSEQLGRDPPPWFQFDWLTKNSGNILKVIEGNYDKRFRSNGNSNQKSINANEPITLNPMVQAVLDRQSRQPSQQHDFL